MNELDEGTVILVGCILFIGGIVYWLFIAWILRFLLKCLRILRRHQNGQFLIERDSDKVALGSGKYTHPCLGQCDEPGIILEKSPTPEYHHNCHAPCATATRSGRYYRGKRRKSIW